MFGKKKWSDPKKNENWSDYVHRLTSIFLYKDKIYVSLWYLQEKFQVSICFEEQDRLGLITYCVPPDGYARCVESDLLIESSHLTQSQQIELLEAIAQHPEISTP